MASFIDIETFKKRLGEIGNAKFIAVAGDGRIVSGQNPLDPDWMFDFAKERFVNIRPGQIGTLQTSLKTSKPVVYAGELALPRSISGQSGRATGHYRVHVQGTTYEFQNLKQALGGTIMLFADDPCFLERLSGESSRSRRLIARNPKALFDNPGMKRNARDFAADLDNGWWLNTNNSEAQVKKWLNVVARVANLSWNHDFRVEF